MEMKKIRISSCLKIVDIRMKWFCVDGRLVCITAAAKIGGKKNWAKKWICASLQWNGSALKNHSHVKFVRMGSALKAQT